MRRWGCSPVRRWRVHLVGQGLAQALGKLSKHGVKQVDRLLSNEGIDVGTFFGYWAPYLVGGRVEIVVALDWTSFARDGHETLVLSMLTGHGRATPLMWRSVESSSLKGNQRRYEDELLRRLRAVMPSGVKVTVVADRGFGSGPMFRYLSEEMGFGVCDTYPWGHLRDECEGGAAIGIGLGGEGRSFSDVAWRRE